MLHQTKLFILTLMPVGLLLALTACSPGDLAPSTTESASSEEVVAPVESQPADPEVYPTGEFDDLDLVVAVMDMNGVPVSAAYVTLVGAEWYTEMSDSEGLSFFYVLDEFIGRDYSVVIEVPGFIPLEVPFVIEDNAPDGAPQVIEISVESDGTLIDTENVSGAASPEVDFIQFVESAAPRVFPSGSECLPGDNLLYFEDFEDGVFDGAVGELQYLEDIEANGGDPYITLDKVDGFSFAPDPLNPASRILAMYPGSATTIKLADSQFDNHVMRMRMRIDGPAQGEMATLSDAILLYWRAAGEGADTTAYALNLSNVAGEAALQQYSEEMSAVIPFPVHRMPDTFEPGNWHDLLFAYYEGRMEIWLDGRLQVSDEVPEEIPPGTFQFIRLPFQENAIQFDDLIICELNTPYSLASRINPEGAFNIALPVYREYDTRLDEIFANDAPLVDSGGVIDPMVYLRLAIAHDYQASYLTAADLYLFFLDAYGQDDELSRFALYRYEQAYSEAD